MMRLERKEEADSMGGYIPGKLPVGMEAMVPGCPEDRPGQFAPPRDVITRGQIDTPHSRTRSTPLHVVHR